MSEHIDEATCLRRFHKVCATGNKDGRGLLPFGPVEYCQNWMIAPLELEGF